MSYIRMFVNWIVSVIQRDKVIGGMAEEVRRLQKSLEDLKATQDDINGQREKAHRELLERIVRLESQFQHLNTQLGGIDLEVSKVRDRLLNHEHDDIKAQGEIRTNLEMMQFKLDYMLNEIRQTRQIWTDKAGEPDVQRLLDTLQRASSQIGGKRKSINSLLEKLTIQPPKQQ